jgi:hypothetical protein
MLFAHSTNAAIEASATLKKLRAEYRLCLAHTDRRYTVSLFVAFLPHDVDPVQFGLAADCDWCSKLKRTTKLDEMLSQMKCNNNKALAPRPSAKPGHFTTMLEELKRTLSGLPGAKPDEFLNRPRKEAKTKQNSLFPTYTHCPHWGCFSFGLRNPTDADIHEGGMHPGQRAQRLADDRAKANNRPPPARKFVCQKCPCTFSSNSFLQKHVAAYDHMSDAAQSRAINTKKRKAEPFARPLPKMAAAPVHEPCPKKFKASDGKPALLNADVPPLRRVDLGADSPEVALPSDGRPSRRCRSKRRVLAAPYTVCIRRTLHWVHLPLRLQHPLRQKHQMKDKANEQTMWQTAGTKPLLNLFLVAMCVASV